MTEGETSVNLEVDGDQMVNEENMDVDHDDAPIKMRSIYEVYENAADVEVTSDADIEVNALLTVMEEPTCYQEAADSVDWRAAMDSELQSINKNKTWSLVKLPPGQKSIGLKWVFKLKKNAEGEIVKHKQGSLPKGMYRSKELTMMRYLHLLQDWIQSGYFWQWQQIGAGKCII